MKIPFLSTLSFILNLQPANQYFPASQSNYNTINLPISKSVIHKTATLWGNKMIVWGNKISLLKNKIMVWGDKIILLGNKITFPGNKIILLGNKIIFRGDKIILLKNKITFPENKITLLRNKITLWGDKFLLREIIPDFSNHKFHPFKKNNFLLQNYPVLFLNRPSFVHVNDPK